MWWAWCVSNSDGGYLPSIMSTNVHSRTWSNPPKMPGQARGLCLDTDRTHQSRVVHPMSFWKKFQFAKILKESPHVNIAQYLGCRVQNDPVNGLVFIKYNQTTLAERFKDKARPLRPDVYLKGLENNDRHLDDLGLTHNDINPHNVTLREDDAPFIIDFNTVQREGEECTSGGTAGWSVDRGDGLGRPRKRLPRVGGNSGGCRKMRRCQIMKSLGIKLTYSIWHQRWCYYFKCFQTTNK